MSVPRAIRASSGPRGVERVVAAWPVRGVYACSYENDSAERSRASVLREHEPPLAVVRVSSLTVFSSEAR